MRLLALCAATTTILGAPARAAETSNGAVFSFQIENDAPMQIDRHYTNGLRFAWLTTPLKPERAGRWAGALLPFTDSGADVRFDFVLGQNLFTPRHLHDLVPDPTEWPFAAWLYLNAGIVAETADVRDQFYANIGIVGPAALGEETQSLLHHAKVPGWQYQLRGEPTFGVQYRRTWRAWRSDGGWLDFDALPYLGLSLGTAHVYGEGGLMLRLGQDLPHDFGPSLGDPGLPGSTPFDTDAPFAWYLFAALDARVSAHDMFLDGGTFRKGPSLDSRTVTGDARFGFVVLWNDVRLTGAYVLRADQFRGQVGDDAFASLTLSFRM
ncbi:MAG: lipid A deacylase LpxR family protein [Alphaproteobacteria bacterium]|nr:lipid A deacylase LpxR family protein [Alphaproteobacteria bacterium]